MKNAISETTRRRLDIQGFVDVDDETLAEVGPWLRLAFGGCAILAAIGTILASPTMLWILVVIAALAAAFPVHPFDLIYNYGIRRFTGTRELPKRKAPTRFACGMGAVMLTVTAWAFQSGSTILGYVLGGQLALVALLVSTTDICIPSMIYGAIFGRPQPVVNKTSSTAQ